MRRSLIMAMLGCVVVPCAQGAAPADAPLPASALARGRYVRISLPGLDRVLSLAEVQVFDARTGEELQKGRPATQSSTDHAGNAALASDGVTNQNFFAGHSISHTVRQKDPWWELDLGAVKDISRIKIYNRSDCCGKRLKGALVEVLDAARHRAWATPIDLASDGSVHDLRTPRKTLVRGRFLRIKLDGTDRVLSLSEVEVIETATGRPLHRSATASQSSVEYEGEARRAIDGNPDPDFSAHSTTHTRCQSNAWWELDLGATQDIGEIKIHNRGDGCGARLGCAIIDVLDETYKSVWDGAIPTASDRSVHDFQAD